MDSQLQIQPRDVNMRGINMKQDSKNEMTPLAFFKVACAYDRWFTRTHKLIFATQGHENFGCDEKLQGLKSQDHKLIVRMAKVTRWAARPQTNIYACSLLNNMTTQVLPRSVTQSLPPQLICMFMWLNICFLDISAGILAGSCQHLQQSLSGGYGNLVCTDLGHFKRCSTLFPWHFCWEAGFIL